MKFIKEPSSKFVLGFCNACKDNCHNDCITQSGCGYCAGYNEGK